MSKEELEKFSSGLNDMQVCKNWIRHKWINDP